MIQMGYGSHMAWLHQLAVRSSEPESSQLETSSGQSPKTWLHCMGLVQKPFEPSKSVDAKVDDSSLRVLTP
jgi:hypothetical protein